MYTNLTTTKCAQLQQEHGQEHELRVHQARARHRAQAQPCAAWEPDRPALVRTNATPARVLRLDRS